MSAPPPHLRLPEALAGRVEDRLGLDDGDGVAAVVDRARRVVLAGTTEKLAAVAAGRVPPGVDPTAIWEDVVAPDADGAVRSWACWPLCTGIGALLIHRGHDVAISVEQRRGPGTPIVDLHSVLRVDGDLVDPYLGPSMPVPPGHDVSAPDAWASWLPDERGRGDHLGVRAGGSTFRYRTLVDDLDTAELAAFCAISADHSGAPRQRTAHWCSDAGLVTVKERADGIAEVRLARGTSPFAETREIVATGPFEDVVRAWHGGAAAGP